MTVSIRYGILGPIESSSWFVKAVASSPNSEIVALACEKQRKSKISSMSRFLKAIRNFAKVRTLM